MKGYMRKIAVDGTETTTEWDRCPTLAEHHEGLDGDRMEKVPHWDRLLGDPKQSCVAYVGSGAKGAEGGLPKPENVRATDEWEKVCLRDVRGLPDNFRLRDHDYLAGPVIVLWGDAAFMRAL